MTNTTNKHLVPFTSSKPLVPGKGGRLPYWRQERTNQTLKDEILDMAKVIRRLSQELIDQILFLQDTSHKSPEETHRAMSRMLGALKQESSTLSSLFALEDLHPALKKIFLDRTAERLSVSPPHETELLPLPTVPDLNKPKPTIFHLLTDKDLEFVTLILAGYKITEAAAKMGIKAETGYLRRHSIKRKAKQALGEKGETDEGNS